MKTMFKKTLLAASVVAFAGVTHAATLSATEHSVTAEYLAGNVTPAGATATDVTFHQPSGVTLTINAEYTLNDTITLASTAEFGAVMPVTLFAAPNVGANRLGMTFSKISGGEVGDKTVTYRLTATSNTGLAANPITTGQTFAISAANLEFKKAKLGSGASLSFTAKTNTNLDLDTSGGAGRTASLVKVVSQFTTTTPSFSKVIDVNANRKQFVGANTAARKVTGTFAAESLVTDVAGFVYARPVTKVVHTVTGDFSWVKDTDANTAGLQPAANVFAFTGTCATPVWTYSTSAVTLKCDATAANTAIVIDADVNAAAYTAGSEPVLPAQDLKVTSEVTYSGATATAKVFDNTAAGSWTLNGANIQIPYMVFGTVGGKAYNQVIVLNNASAVSGDVYVDVYKEDGTVVLSNKKVATAAANSAANIAGAIKTELAAASAADGKFSVKVVANIPETKATVYSAFVDTVTGERIIVNNDSKVQTK